MDRQEPGRKQSLDEVVARFLEERPADVESFLAHHPEHIAELRHLLPAMREMEEAAQTFVSGAWDEWLPVLEKWTAARERIAAGLSLSGAPKEQPTPSASARDSVSQALARLETPAAPSTRYELQGEIARGGQGAVLAVWDATLQRHLAMKVALAGKEDGGKPTPDAMSLGRFLEEAHVTARLDHPGIVPVHDLGLDAERRVFFTMKLVKGRDLRSLFELVRSGQEGWTQTRALSVLLKVCEALSYAHSKGVIHRDLKPSNVMVGKFGEVYVMDWGLARVLGKEDKKDIRIQPEATDALRSPRHDAPENLDSPLVTMDGDVVGTPAYMAPEQARGELAAMGPHSDVYAVGAMLYQLLTGQMPYVRSGSRLSNRAVWARVQEGPPDPVHALAPAVPVELEAICTKAMARDPRARYADTSALAEDLRAYLEHRVVSAYETGALAELRKWVGRNRGLSAACAAGVVLALGGLAGIGYVQAEGKRVADAERANVMRLSAFQELEDLEKEADELWPPGPEHLKTYDEWLRRARALVASLEPSPDGTRIGHRAQLALLEARALPYSDEEREQDRRTHPRFQELGVLEARFAACQKADVVRRGQAEPEPVVLDEGVLSYDPAALNDHAWSLVEPDTIIPNELGRGLALARLSVTIPTNNVELRANRLDTLAWACFANGLDDEALEASRRALEEAPLEQRENFHGYSDRLRARIDAARSGATLRELEGRRAALEAKLGERRTWRFGSEEDRWWHTQLGLLILRIEAFADPVVGRIDGLSREHGWGIARRRAWAGAVEESTSSGREPARRWAEAIASIQDLRACPVYHGLVIEPQLGLVPIGRDPDSGLWEFAYPLTGSVSERGSDGRLSLEEASGLVLVFLPGGSFQMGAQAGDPAGPNYDRNATLDEFPVHAVKLKPFFLSKYEVTQAQWVRVDGNNPSLHQPPAAYAPSLLHPVEQVSWNDCSEFCRRTGLSLPSEAQWEHGARGGTTTPWWTGDERDSLMGAVNLADRAARRAAQPWPAIGDWPELDDGCVMHAPVDDLRANPFGLHHVIGNVWEWCLDFWHNGFYFVSPAQDPVAPTPGTPSRVFRGSSYNDSAPMGRSAFRSGISPEMSAFDVGLRPARALTGEIHYAGTADAGR